MAEVKVIDKRCRVKKTSKEQYEIYCSFLEQHEDMRFKKDTDQSIQPLWDQLTSLLNSTNSGPSKDRKSWQKTFENWRNSIRHKKRQEEAYRQATGGGPERPSELKKPELRAPALWGKAALEGVCGSNVEVGFGPLPSTQEEEVQAEEVQPEEVQAEEVILQCLEIIATEDSNVGEAIATTSRGQRDDATAVPTKTGTGGKGRNKRKLESSTDVQLEMMLGNDQDNTEALREIGTQLRRIADSKEAEILESKNRTDALSNIAEAITILARIKLRNKIKVK